MHIILTEEQRMYALYSIAGDFLNDPIFAVSWNHENLTHEISTVIKKIYAK